MKEERPSRSEQLAAAAAAKVGIMRVKTPSECAAAMETGVRHIIIEEHLDLRGLPLLKSNPPVLFQFNSKVQSIQVCLDQGSTSQASLKHNVATAYL
jgi:hypothetical protein